MVISTMVLLFMDILGRCNGNPGSVLSRFNHIGNFIVFTLNLLLPSLWFLYVHYNIYKDETKTKNFMYRLITINIINLVLVIWNIFEGYYYYIDEYNIFHRGPLFFISVALVIILLVVTFILIIKNKENIETKYYRSLMFFAFPPIVGIVLQASFYGYSLVLNSITISILVIFLNIQNKNMYKDHLTGVCNRKKLDIYLKDKIDNSRKGKTFSAIMIDLNDFKEINDKYGHDVGDDALQKTAEILKSCIRSNDIVCRFGGDEFYVILDIYREVRLKEVVDRIKYRFKEFNEKLDQPYKINFSMGYDIYDYNSRMTVREFQSHLDMLMYENKDDSKKN